MLIAQRTHTAEKKEEKPTERTKERNQRKSRAVQTFHRRNFERAPLLHHSACRAASTQSFILNFIWLHSVNNVFAVFDDGRVKF